MAPISNHAGTGAAVSSIARSQEGLVTREQLEACGLSRDQIKRWIRDGRLHPVLRTVYALGHRGVGPRGRMRAAVLACPGAVISHRSAAALLRIREVAPVVMAFPGPTEVRTVYGIPCTTVARTIVDLAGSSEVEKLRETVELAATRRALDVAAIEAVLAAGPRRRGAPALRGVLEEWRPVAETAKYSTVRSLFEAKLLPLVVAARLPIPKVNALVPTAERILEVDLFWPRQRFVVEADSRRHHAIEVAFERDHRRNRELIAAGYGILRVSWREAEREPEAVFAVVRSELERRG